MIDQDIQQELDKATDFLQRQRLLKRLWKLHEKRRCGATDSTPARRPLKTSGSRHRAAARQAQPTA